MRVLGPCDGGAEVRAHTRSVGDGRPRLPLGRTASIDRMCLIAGDGKDRELIVLFHEEEGGRIQIYSIPEDAEAEQTDYALEIKGTEAKAKQHFDCLVEKLRRLEKGGSIIQEAESLDEADTRLLPWWEDGEGIFSAGGDVLP